MDKKDYTPIVLALFTIVMVIVSFMAIVIFM